MTRDVTHERELALDSAVSLYRDSWDSLSSNEAFLETAALIFNWLTGPVAFTFTFGPVLDQNTGEPTGRTIGGTPMQLHDTEQVDLTVAVSDVKGAIISDDPGTTTDDVSWTIDNTSVASLTISADTRTCTIVAGLPGSGVVTVSLGDLTATQAVDVIPSGATKLEISEGTPIPQP
jgi:hypothetical protein